MTCFHIADNILGSVAGEKWAKMGIPRWLPGGHI
jgi:hypothetical protein